MGSDFDQWIREVAEQTGRTEDDVEEPHSKQDRERLLGFDETDIEKYREEDLEKRHRDHSRKLENDSWFLYHVSESLTDYFEEHGEIWALRYQEGQGFTPVMRITEDQIIINSEDYFEDSYIEMETEDSRVEHNIISWFENSGYSGELIGKDYIKEDIENVPRIDIPGTDRVSEESLEGRYVFPGLEKEYRRQIVERLERKN